MGVVKAVIVAPKKEGLVVVVKSIFPGYDGSVWCMGGRGRKCGTP